MKRYTYSTVFVRCWLQILVICQLLFKIRAVTIKAVLFIIQNKNSIMLTRHSPFFYSEISGESRATELQAVQPVEDKEPYCRYPSCLP